MGYTRASIRQCWIFQKISAIMGTSMDQQKLTWKMRAKRLKEETFTLYLAVRHPGTPWYAKVFAGFVVAYALSPIDLIPDFVPILGYLDDLILVPLGVALALKMIPPEVMAECRVSASEHLDDSQPVNWIAALVIASIWIAIVIVGIRWLINLQK